MAERPKTDELFSGNGLAGEKSAGTLMKEVTEDLSTLIRKEIELAKQELGDSVSAKLKGAAIIGIVAVLGFFALIFVLLAVRDGFNEFLPAWAADFATAAVLITVGIIAAMFARKKLATPISTELTKLSIREDVDTLKSLGRR
ncbi:MAG TPA: phage holin family protein [Actinomycetota bacterium]|nr:phage holin family protein [Actinomycetota bacterium]